MVAIVGYATYYTEASVRAEGNSGITASGEVFKDSGLTCAMRSRKFGGSYRVTAIESGKSVVVRHSDFGPNKKQDTKGVIVDLSPAAFKKLAPLSKGKIRVQVEAL